ncbi:hypothetical protein A0J61_06611 [Choanephora cucurbitarum]|uniref:C2H2-type domain-containing protein n=1 Tax=Choanephora cucurbitarum TaxID=101091 RepID=A0A1C7N8R5_9FUNG|nr:hypothetical protein A0J61_06611 [Choanephora cucurbitarum]
MSSLLTFQLIQQQQEQEKKENSCLPSPPSSFCGEENVSVVISEQKLPPQLQCRRDSLQTVFNDMTLKDCSTSLPENYTIDHSTQKHLTASKPANRKIFSSSFNPSFLHPPGATATAAATGGLTVRNNNTNSNNNSTASISIHSNHNRSRQQDISNSVRKKSRGLSESFSGQYRCNDCGKSYKHPNCLQKHRWEHSEEWEITRKLPLTKHQQVQMLEAAAILAGINKNYRPKDEEEDVQIDDDDDNKEDSEDEESIVIDDEEEKGHTSSIDSLGIFMDDL